MSTLQCYSGSLPLRLTHGRADASLQAKHRHHGLRVHQGLDYCGQAGSLDPLKIQPKNPDEHRHHGLRAHQCLDYCVQARSLDPLALKTKNQETL